MASLLWFKGLSEADQELAASIAKSVWPHVTTRDRPEIEVLELQTITGTVASPTKPLGAQGEAVVEELIRDTWSASEVRRVASTPEMSDLHVVTPVGVVAVEVKNKSIITRADVDKALRDLETLKGRETTLAAYLFVSLRSINIPSKGALMVELVAGTPVVWFGTKSVDDLRAHLPGLLRVITCLVGRLAEINRLEDSSDAYDAFLQRVKVAIGKIADARSQVEGLQLGVDTMKSQVTKLQGLVAELYTLFGIEVGIADKTMTCHCGKKYVRKAAFDKHRGACPPC